VANTSWHLKASYLFIFRLNQYIKYVLTL